MLIKLCFYNSTHDIVFVIIPFLYKWNLPAKCLRRPPDRPHGSALRHDLSEQDLPALAPRAPWAPVPRGPALRGPALHAPGDGLRPANRGDPRDRVPLVRGEGQRDAVDHAAPPGDAQRGGPDRDQPADRRLPRRAGVAAAHPRQGDQVPLARASPPWPPCR